MNHLSVIIPEGEHENKNFIKMLQSEIDKLTNVDTDIKQKVIRLMIESSIEYIEKYYDKFGFEIYLKGYIDDKTNIHCSGEHKIATKEEPIKICLFMLDSKFHKLEDVKEKYKKEIEEVKQITENERNTLKKMKEEQENFFASLDTKSQSLYAQILRLFRTMDNFYISLKKEDNEFTSRCDKLSLELYIFIKNIGQFSYDKAYEKANDINMRCCKFTEEYYNDLDLRKGIERAEPIQYDYNKEISQMLE